MVIGQELICDKIYKSNLDTFPRTLMLIGEHGGGKHLIISEIAHQLNLEVRDISEELSIDLIDEIYQRTDPYLYIINLDILLIKQQNMILKLIEEPLKNSYMVLITEAGSNVLPTIFNRCQKWELSPYSKEYLATFTDNQLILKLANTPGQILEFLNSDLDELFELADKITTKIGVANLPNVLTISSKITTKDEKGKVPAKLLIKALVVNFRDACFNNATVNYIDAYKRTQKLAADSKIKNIDLKYLLERYLVDIREIMRRT